MDLDKGCCVVSSGTVGFCPAGKRKKIQVLCVCNSLLHVRCSRGASSVSISCRSDDSFDMASAKDSLSVEHSCLKDNSIAWPISGGEGLCNIVQRA